MSSQVISLTVDDIRAHATWPLCIDAIREGHKLPKAQIGDSFVGGGDNTMLVRSAWIEGLAAGVKAATVVPGNPDRTPPLASVNAQVMLFDPNTGLLTALLDGTEITAWKTAADSALGCDLLARNDAETLLMIGAGAMAEPLIRAHLSVRPDVKNILLWNRSLPRVKTLCDRLQDLTQSVDIASNLESALEKADIVSSATMATEPFIKGKSLKPGAHLDLVGAYKADMREADDDCHERGIWFVDSFNTTFDHIGELQIPLEEGTITRKSVKGDLHALVAGQTGRTSEEEITVFKNGGGAHLDVMVCSAIAAAFCSR